MRSHLLATSLTLLLLGAPVARVAADETDAAKSNAEISATSGDSSSSSDSKSTSSAAASAPAHVALLKGAKVASGLLTTYHKGSHVYAEIGSGDLGKEYIVLISLARGIGSGPLLGGMTWGFGDDWVWTFEKVDDKMHIVRRNVRFRASSGTPEASAVKNAYTDSILFSLPILTTGPKGGHLVDLSQVFMTDLPQISQVLPGFVFSPSKSAWAAVKGFDDNLELEVAATYASSGNLNIDSVADSRGVTLNVHYSISKLPTTGYTPRQADDRIGYFLTVVKDYSKKTNRDRFVRYINRWDLSKADPSADLSPPKKPIIFWLEKTVPFAYRKPIRDGILEWNKAFEKAGFVNAIEVRQQPDNAEWDPEDINYNTFRWITSSAGFAMGPSRVNPRTGQILDADIIFDADFLSYWKSEFETLTPATVAALTGGPLDMESYRKQQSAVPESHRHSFFCNCALNGGMAHQFAFGSAALLAKIDPAQLEKEREKMVVQGLKEVTMHEVGHTLGLRHNFKASTYLTLEEINNPERTAEVGMAASVMDYTPTNIVPKAMKQGDYFSPTIGPYDMWAIEYGYKPQSGGTDGEVKELQKIAARSGEPGLAYGPDEEVRGIDPDPRANRFDLSDDALAYARQRAQLVTELIPGLVDRMTEEGDDYVQARRTFNVLLATHGQAMYFAARNVGGLYTSRSHKGDKGGDPPITAIDPKTQRDALALLEEQVFSDKPYNFSAELYNHLGPSRWNHWGSGATLRPDFPAHDVIAMWQDRILSQLMSPVTLERIHDTELKIPSDEDAFTSAELIERLTKAIFSEVDDLKPGEYTNRKPAISSLRRNLQRIYIKRLATLAMGSTSAPDDCQTIAFGELAGLEARIERLMKKNTKLDSYSLAHLSETASRARKVLEARLSLSSP